MKCSPNVQNVCGISGLLTDDGADITLLSLMSTHYATLH